MAFAMPRLFCLRRPTFVAEQKWAKVSLEPAVLRTPFCPDVYWGSYSSCGASSSERRWTLRLPPSPRFSALAWLVDGGLCQQKSSRMALAWRADGGLAADFQRTCITWSALPVRSAAIANAPPAFVRSRDTIPALSQIRTAQQNTNLNQGQRLPDPEAIIIGGRQAYSYYTPCQYAATTTKQSGPCGTTQGSQPPTGVLRGTP